MNLMARLTAIAALMLTLASCLRPAEISVEEDLRAGSAANGLALIRGRGQSIAVLPFDASESYFRSEPGIEIAGFSANGRFVSWCGDPLQGQRKFVIQSTDGSDVLTIAEPKQRFNPVALSDSAQRFSFLKPSPSREGQAGLFWTMTDLQQGGQVDTPTGDSPEGDWSPDGRFLTYEKNGAVHVFDTMTGTSNQIADGVDPTWSRSGNGISFRTSDGRIRLVLADGSLIPTFLNAHRAMSPIRWSPDGRFVVFAEERSLAIPLLTASYDLMVCRMRDGRCTSVRRLGAASPDVRGFHWIINYRHFCANCAAGEPFQ